MKPLFLLLLLAAALKSQAQTDRQGIYFKGEPHLSPPLPQFEAVRDLLPSPIYDEDPKLVMTYWKAWELAFRHFHQPTPENKFISQFIDAAFNDNIFLWDTAFMTMFCNVANGIVPGIHSLDNFYVKQHESGEISREINRTTGIDFAPWINKERKPLFSRWGFNTGPGPVEIRYTGRETPEPPPALTLDALDHPVLAWAELESFSFTGDTLRLRSVREPLVHYYEALKKYLRQGNGLYVTDWAGMDNSPRNPFLSGGGTGIDISSEMVMFARQLGVVDELTGMGDPRTWEREADSLAGEINRYMWDPDRRFYFDCSPAGERTPVKTIAAFWTLLGGVATKEQAAALEAELRNPRTFGRTHPVPSCAADEPGYISRGGYWRGAVWPSTNTMVIRGLQRYGYDALAREIAMKHVHAVAEICATTGTIWENYAPDSVAPGRHVDGAPVVRDMVGWSGIGPILYFLEFGVGLKPDAASNTLRWEIRSPMRSGCERFRFNGHVISLVAAPLPGEKRTRITVNTDGPFTLVVVRDGITRTESIPKGKSGLEIP
jgi:hypothetical protein